MDKSTFEKLILSDAEISHNEAVLLEDLQEVFPYCQSAHILIAKDSKQKKSMLYPKKLRKASAYILDRKILQQYLTQPKPIITTPIEAVLPQKNTLIEEIENTIREIKASRGQLLKIAETEPIIDSKIKPNPAQSTYNHKINSSESRLGDELIQTESKSTIELFISYLNHEIPKTNIIPRQDDVIKRFLETEPKITRSLPNTFLEEKTEDLSSESSELKIELVTENYALILLKQNKREKAIEIYKKLILKNPNKSAYFEAKLNEI